MTSTPSSLLSLNRSRVFCTFRIIHDRMHTHIIQRELGNPTNFQSHLTMPPLWNFQPQFTYLFFPQRCERRKSFSRVEKLSKQFSSTHPGCRCRFEFWKNVFTFVQCAAEREIAAPRVGFCGRGKVVAQLL